MRAQIFELKAGVSYGPFEIIDSRLSQLKKFEFSCVLESNFTELNSPTKNFFQTQAAFSNQP
jgi:hypothetical protein